MATEKLCRNGDIVEIGFVVFLNLCNINDVEFLRNLRYVNYVIFSPFKKQIT